MAFLEWRACRPRYLTAQPTRHGTSPSDGGHGCLYSYFSWSFTSAKAFTANSKSSRECAADTCVRIRAVPCGTTG